MLRANSRANSSSAPSSAPSSDSSGGPTQAALKLLERRLASQWAWVRFAVRWRLYRSGYHLHARGAWRRAHPQLREYQMRAQAHEMRYLVKKDLTEEDKALLDELAGLTPEELQAVGREVRAEAQAEMKRREALKGGKRTQAGRDQSASDESVSDMGNYNPDRETSRSDRSISKPSASKRGPKKSSLPADTAAAAHNAANGEISLTGRQLNQMHDAEAQILVARAQEVGLIARTSLLTLLTGDDSEAMAFQQRQIQQLQDELAPLGSRPEERLLAEVIANARFQSMLWQTHSADIIAAQHRPPSSDSSRIQRRSSSHDSDTRAMKAERRYMQALRDLINVRRNLGPSVQVNVANLIGDGPDPSPNRAQTTVSPLDPAAIDEGSDS